MNAQDFRVCAAILGLADSKVYNYHELLAPNVICTSFVISFKETWKCHDFGAN